MKPPAPPKVRAFIRAFRDINSALFLEIQTEIKNWCKSVEVNSEPLDANSWSRAAESMIRLFEGENPCCDPALQIHFGAATPEDCMNWHFDHKNSLLHLSITLKGSRKVYFKVSDVENPSDGDLESLVLSLEEGDIYVANPNSFYHALKFDEMSYRDRSITIQCRLFFPDECVPKILIEEVNNIMARHYGNHSFKFPTQEDVDIAEKASKKMYEGNLLPSLNYVDGFRVEARYAVADTILLERDAPFPALRSLLETEYHCTSDSERLEVFWRLSRVYYVLSRTKNFGAYLSVTPERRRNFAESSANFAKKAWAIDKMKQVVQKWHAVSLCRLYELTGEGNLSFLKDQVKISLNFDPMDEDLLRIKL
jgi:hypothetical protein